MVHASRQNLRVAMLAFGAVLTMSLASCGGHPAYAEDAGLAPFLSHDASECVPLTAIEKVAQTVDLSPAQFQFVRALFVAMPPISKTLPPGDRAIFAVDMNGVVMAALVDGEQSCARFEAPPFLQNLVFQVGKGVVTHAGKPA